MKTCCLCQNRFEGVSTRNWCPSCTKDYHRRYDGRVGRKMTACRLRLAATRLHQWADLARERKREGKRLTRAEILEVAALEVKRDKLADAVEARA